MILKQENKMKTFKAFKFPVFQGSGPYKMYISDCR